jgi:hypothetical protein
MTVLAAAAATTEADFETQSDRVNRLSILMLVTLGVIW